MPPSIRDDGFYEARVWIGRSSPDWAYFGHFTARPLFQNKDNAAIDICSTQVSGSSTRDSSLDGNYDMMIQWFRGEFGNPWTDSSGNYK